MSFSRLSLITLCVAGFVSCKFSLEPSGQEKKPKPAINGGGETPSTILDPGEPSPALPSDPPPSPVDKGNKEIPPPSPTASLELKAYASGVLRASYRNSGTDLKAGDAYEMRFLVDASLEDSDCGNGTVGYSGQAIRTDRIELRVEMRGVKNVQDLKELTACIVRVSDHRILTSAKSPILEEDLSAPIPGAPPIVNYARVCREAIGPVPTINCHDGQVIPITVNGKEVTTLAAKSDCDKPVELEMPNGQCIPGSRLMNIETFDPDVQMIAICRRYESRAVDSPIYDDIAIIQHRKSTGATCFYQMPHRPTDGTRVPDPGEMPSETPEGKMTAEKFWLTPQKTAERLCIKCHDSDPFIYNPWAAQMKNFPTNSFGKYLVLGKEFAKWPVSVAIDTNGGNKCASCHRIGHMNTCQNLDASVGLRKMVNQLESFFKFPESHWMPPDHQIASLKEWNSQFQNDYNALKACCENPLKTECVSKQISWNRGY